MHDILANLKAENQQLTECLAKTKSKLGLDPFSE